MTWLLVAAGGAIGSALRHGLNQLIHQRFLSATFPIGIFLVNVIGSTAIGIIAGLLAQKKTDALGATIAAVYLHGLAGDIAASRSGMRALIASDIAKHLGEAFLQTGGEPEKP